MPTKGGHNSDKIYGKLMDSYGKAAVSRLKIPPPKWSNNAKHLSSEQIEISKKHSCDNTLLGEGTFGTVGNGTSTNDGSLVAIKSPKTLCKSNAGEGIKEVLIWKQLGGSPLSHPIHDAPIQLAMPAPGYWQHSLPTQNVRSVSNRKRE